MEDLLNEFQPLIKHATTSISDMNSSMELLQNITELNNPLSSQLFLDYFSTDYLTNPNNSIPQSPYTTDVEGTHQPLLCSLGQSNSRDFRLCGDMNITTTVDVAETPPSPTDVGSGSGGSNRMDKTSGIGARKRKRRIEAEGGEKKPKEVIHVRAKRGQATDSHSLAERVRRERINEKLKVLQDLVPGCYKTMGMAVMLDVIINYVRSLQNQIEFLSMKLSAASMFYDFNSPEAEAIETLQKATNNGDAHGAERLVRDGYGEIHPQIHSTWPF